MAKSSVAALLLLLQAEGLSTFDCPATQGCSDAEHCCYINQYSGWCGDGSPGKTQAQCTGQWRAKPILEADVGTFDCPATQGCTDAQYCCYINQYSGWCGDGTPGQCSGEWRPKPVLEVDVDSRALQLTGSFQIYNEELWCGTVMGGSVPIHDGQCIDITGSSGTEGITGVQFTSSDSYQYKVFGSGDCTGDYRQYQAGICGTLPSASQVWGGKGVRFATPALQANVTSCPGQCTGWSLKACVLANPGCQAECESACPDRCSGCSCGITDCSQWVCDACLAECQCDQRDACCPTMLI